MLPGDGKKYFLQRGKDFFEQDKNVKSWRTSTPAEDRTRDFLRVKQAS